jgi:hypothetical protein
MQCYHNSVYTDHGIKKEVTHWHVWGIQNMHKECLDFSLEVLGWKNKVCVLMVLSSTNPFHNRHIQDKDNCSGINAEHTSIHINGLYPRKKFLKHHTKTAVNGLYCGS